MAVAQVEAGLTALGRLGHRYYLEPGPPPDADQWPRVMFHVEAAPNGRVVASDFARHELGEGWFYTLAEAQHAEGMRAQFAGRGGVGDRSVPMLVDGSRGPQPDPGPAPKDNSAVIAAWKQGAKAPGMEPEDGHS